MTPIPPDLSLDILGFVERITKIKYRDFNIEKLAGDASDRKFYRVQFKNRSWVLLQTVPFDEKRDPYLHAQVFLKSINICVPEIHGVKGSLGVMLLEDLGSNHLDRVVQNLGEKGASKFYFLAIDELIKLQAHANSPLARRMTKSDPMFWQEPLDEKKATAELMFMKDHLIEGYLKYKISSSENTILKTGFEIIAAHFQLKNPVLCHRDYHSKNIMVRDTSIGIVDFQDMRYGPAAYDLASLLRDSYVQLSEDLVEELLKYYYQMGPAKNIIPKKIPRAFTPEMTSSNTLSWEKFQLNFDWISLQRNLKAMGSFGYITSVKKKPGYTQYLKPTWESAKKRLTQFSKLRPLMQTLENIFKDRL